MGQCLTINGGVQGTSPRRKALQSAMPKKGNNEAAPLFPQLFPQPPPTSDPFLGDCSCFNSERPLRCARVSALVVAAAPARFASLDRARRQCHQLCLGGGHGDAVLPAAARGDRGACQEDAEARRGTLGTTGTLAAFFFYLRHSCSGFWLNRPGRQPAPPARVRCHGTFCSFRPICTYHASRSTCKFA